MKVYIRSLMGNHWTVSGLDPDSTVQFLKRMIRIKCGIMPHLQVLTHRSRALEDAHTLERCGIQSHATIDLTVRTLTGIR